MARAPFIERCLKRRRLLALLLGAGPLASAAAPAAPHVTRAVQVFLQLEQALLDALRKADVAQLDLLLGEEFQLLVQQPPSTMTAREDWLLRMRQPGASAYAPTDMSVREIGPVAIVSFTLRPASGAAAGALPLSVVDIWERNGAQWVLTTRHAAVQTTPRRPVPGERVDGVSPKQI